MSDTLSAVISKGGDERGRPALHLGLAGDAPQTPPARFTLVGIDRVEIARGAKRTVQRFVQEGANVLSLAIDDGRMSSRHARITRAGHSWILEDLDSKNGTWVGMQRVNRHKLGDGDAFVVGHTVLVFRTNGGEAGDAEVPPAAAAFGLTTMSARLAEDFRQLALAAKSSTAIEIGGETGTGKEVIAKAVHQLSGRPGKFVPVNCGSLAPHLVESELFGHKKGAFTNAAEDRVGLIRSAHGGTLFLDEIGELPLAAQASLLRVLQEREVQPVGADQPIKVDFRLVTATLRDLEADVEAKRFRADLRSRLRGVSIELPPLRERSEDLGHLVATLLHRLAPERSIAFSADALAAIYAYGWPDNVRELEKALEAALIVAGERIELHHLPPSVRRPAATPPVAAGPLSSTDDELREALVAALARHAGNVAAVGRELGKDPTQIRRWMKRFALSRDEG